MGNNNVVGEPAIVPYVCGGHNHAVIADARVRAGFHGSVQRDVFADRVAAAYNEAAKLCRLLEVLGVAAEDGRFADFVVRAEMRAVLDDHMRRYAAAIPNDDVRLDHCEGPDADMVSKLRLRADDRQGMDIHRRDSWCG